MRLRHATFLGSAIALAAASPATAAQVTVKGLDTPSFEPARVEIAPGDTVVWTFPGTASPHNVRSDSPNWDYTTGLNPVPPGPDGTWTFEATGIYHYHCEFHANMQGEVVVGDPPPPPPPPLSEQPFPNDGAITASGFETGGLDTTRPALRDVRAKRSGKRVTVSFDVSERSLVTVRVQRGGRTVKTRKAAASRRGSVSVRGLKSGRYAVKVTATDVAGNMSRSRSAAFRIR